MIYYQASGVIKYLELCVEYTKIVKEKKGIVVKVRIIQKKGIINRIANFQLGCHSLTVRLIQALLLVLLCVTV